MPRTKASRDTDTKVEDKRLLVIQVGEQLLYDVVTFPFFIALCLTWRLPTLWRELKDKTTPQKRQVVWNTFGKLILDIISFVALLFVTITAIRLPGTIRLLTGKGSDESNGYRDDSDWHKVVLTQAFLVAVQIISFLSLILVNILRWRKGEMDRRFKSQYHAYSQMDNYVNSLFIPIQAFLLCLGDVFVTVFFALPIVATIWRLPSYAWFLRYKNETRVPFISKAVKHEPYFVYYLITLFEFGQLILDVLCLPLFVLLHLLVWKLPSYYRQIWKPTYEEYSKPREILIDHVKDGLFDVLCALIFLLLVVTVYRLPSVLKALKERDRSTENWQDIVMREVIQREERQAQNGREGNHHAPQETAESPKRGRGRPRKSSASPTRSSRSKSPSRKVKVKTEEVEAPASPKSPAKRSKSPARGRSKSPSRSKREEEEVRGRRRVVTPLRFGFDYS